MSKYRKKSVVIDAIQIKQRMTVETLEGVMTGEPGDWLIFGVEGEAYFCKDSIFKKTYEEEPINTPIIPGSTPHNPFIPPVYPYVPGPNDWYPWLLPHYEPLITWCITKNEAK